jgi:outer membrane protein insertion porin family
VGGVLRVGFPVTEYVTFGARYSLVRDDITLDEDLFFTDPDGSGPDPSECDPLKASRYLCDELGKNLTSAIGYTVSFDNTNGIRATRGHRLVFSQDFAGLGGDVKYLRTRGDATKYWGLPAGFTLSLHGEGGYIYPFEDDPNEGQDAVRLTDRFFGPQMRGFDIRGIGPRIVRRRYISDTEVDESDDFIFSDALGGRAYYMGRIEIEFPTTSTFRSLGLRPSAFVDIGSVWNLTEPTYANGGLLDIPGKCSQPDNDSDTDTNPQIVNLDPGETCVGVGGPGSTYIANTGFKEDFLGNSAKPRLSVGIGVNWVSPFGPLRIDIAKALMTQEGDETKLFSFNVGTQF